jgi:S1-C subfamily serine protease
VSTRGRLDLDVAVRLAAPQESTVVPAAASDGRRRAVIAVVAALALVATALVFYRWGAGASRPQASTAVSATRSATPQPSTAAIYTAVAPSVVSIVATHAGSPPSADSGTGVVVNADATILTALHVVSGADAVRITFADGTTSTATVTAADPTIDIAALAPATLPSVVVPAVLGRSDQLAVGDGVIAIGDQLGLTRSTTTGVVSGLNRQATVTGGRTQTGLIQFDAAVNPGSSGGPLLNAKGQIVGIVVALANPTDSDTFVGVGFAVPITSAVGARGGSRAPQQ